MREAQAGRQADTQTRHMVTMAHRAPLASLPYRRGPAQPRRRTHPLPLLAHFLRGLVGLVVQAALQLRVEVELEDEIDGLLVDEHAALVLAGRLAAQGGRLRGVRALGPFGAAAGPHDSPASPRALGTASGCGAVDGERPHEARPRPRCGRPADCAAARWHWHHLPNRRHHCTAGCARRACMPPPRRGQHPHSTRQAPAGTSGQQRTALTASIRGSIQREREALESAAHSGACSDGWHAGCRVR